MNSFSLKRKIRFFSFSLQKLQYSLTLFPLQLKTPKPVSEKKFTGRKRTQIVPTHLGNKFEFEGVVVIKLANVVNVLKNNKKENIFEFTQCCVYM
jgi:hypothetical protein